LKEFHGGGFAVGEIEDAVEAGSLENLPYHGWSVAENEPTVESNERRVQYHQVADTLRRQHFDSGEVDDDITIRLLIRDIVQVLKFRAELRLLRQGDYEKIA